MENLLREILEELREIKSKLSSIEEIQEKINEIQESHITVEKRDDESDNGDSPIDLSLIII